MTTLGFGFSPTDEEKADAKRRQAYAEAEREPADDKPTVTPAVAPRAEERTAAAEIAAAHDEAAKAMRAKFAPVGLDALTKNPEAMRYLFRLGEEGKKPTVEDTKEWMPLGKVCMVAAPGGTGKSTFLAALAMSVAAGVDVISGLRPEGMGGAGRRVLFVLAEEDMAEIHRKLFQAARGLDEDVKRRVAANLHVFAGAGQAVKLYDEIELREDRNKGGHVNRLTTDPTLFAETLRDVLNERPESAPPWSLVILDPASRFSGARDENDNKGATAFVTELEKLAETNDKPTVLVAHHTGKGKQDAGAEAARGASAFVDGVRWVANMTRWTCENADKDAPNTVDVTVSKSNYTAIAPSMPTLTIRVLRAGEEGGGVSMKRETAAETAERMEYAKKQKEKAAAEKRAAAAGKAAENPKTAQEKAEAPNPLAVRPELL